MLPRCIEGVLPSIDHLKKLALNIQCRSNTIITNVHRKNQDQTMNWKENHVVVEEKSMHVPPRGGAWMWEGEEVVSVIAMKYFTGSYINHPCPGEARWLGKCSPATSSDGDGSAEGRGS
uniref:Uncharacterized protein n=1 Tax=Oryza nivara TaxID=4536 RepID=A0A0E0GRI8_ORYNI